MKKLLAIQKYLQYKQKAQSKFKVHSPFVYDLITKVLEDSNQYPEYKVIRGIRQQYKKNKTPVEVIDFGAAAGKRSYESYYRKVSDILKKAAQRKKYSKLLFKLVKHFQPENILELGTSLGISTACFSLANPNAKIHSIEGCSGIAAIADETFKKNQLQNIKIHIGNFNKVLPELVKKNQKLDFVYFDGNHRKQATLDYFQLCLPHVNNDSIFVFDDIYWSKGMEDAWEEIKKHPQISVTVDVFQMGLVFFRKELSKQDFVLKY